MTKLTAKLNTPSNKEKAEKRSYNWQSYVYLTNDSHMFIARETQYVISNANLVWKSTCELFLF